MESAVEWLENELNLKGKLTSVDFYQAKEMEKEQIMYAHIEGFFSEPFKSRKGQAEQYYNETFKAE